MKLLKKLTKKKWLESQPSRVSSSALILEDSDGRALIVKANYKQYWTFPGGVVDIGETPKECAVRETFEEVGLQIDTGLLEFVAVINRRSDFADTYQFVFNAPLAPGMITDVALQVTEIDEFMLVTKDEVKSDNRRYGKVIGHWANGRTGYIEQTFGKNDE